MTIAAYGPIRKEFILRVAGGRKSAGGSVPPDAAKSLADAYRSEPRGYMAATQAPDGVIHLVSSRLHYRSNVAGCDEAKEELREIIEFLHGFAMDIDCVGFSENFY